MKHNNNNNNYKPKIEQLYGRSYLTEDEHDFAEQEIKNFCTEYDLHFFYYRKLKNGHEPMWREFKIEGPRGLLKKFEQEFCIDNGWRN